MEGPWSVKWTIEKALSVGGQGATFTVRSTKTKALAVLKILKKQDDVQSRRRMYMEVTSLDGISKTGCKVPKILDTNIKERENIEIPLYFVMEYVNGITLSDKIEKDGTLSLDKSIQIGLQLCETIEIAHKLNVVHRDIKPKNIIINEINSNEFHVFVLDFGLSFNRDNPIDLTRMSETIENSFLSLPELRIEGSDKRDPRSDITFIVAIVFYCLTGISPGNLVGHDGHPPHRRTNCNLNASDIDNVKKLRLINFFDQGFESNLNSRYNTIVELKDRLNDILNPKALSSSIDPIDFAKSIHNEYLQTDVQTQRKYFINGVNQLKNTLYDKSNYYHTKIKPFSVSAVDVKLQDITTWMPLNLSLNQLNNAVFFIEHTDKSHRIFICYVFLAIKAQVEIQRMIILGTKGSQPTEPIREWARICNYHGVESPSEEVLGIVITDFNACIIESIRELRNRHLQS